ncbi:MAG: hypothetical protein Q8T04_11455 [Bacteroidota bacterium]|nr:hypothetical protein [Bacteroidota bacterium]
MAQLSGKVLKTVFIGLFFLTGISGCKDEYVSVIPYTPVYLDINLANRTELIPVGGYFKVNGGYGGIIIYHDGADSSQPFFAFDATCTYEISAKCSVETDGSGVAICPCCGTQYMLVFGYGSPQKGLATEPLKQYKVTYSNGRLIIKN